jgi:hypothetical protein
MQRAATIKHVGMANPVMMRLRRFWQSQAQAAASGDLREAEERGQLVHGINPAWTQVRLGVTLGLCSCMGPPAYKQAW